MGLCHCDDILNAMFYVQNLLSKFPLNCRVQDYSFALDIPFNQATTAAQAITDV